MTIDEADARNDDSVTLKECVFRRIPPGSRAQIAVTADHNTFFGSVSIEETGQPKRTVPLVVNKPLPIVLVASRVYTVRVTIAFTGQNPAKVTVTTVILKTDESRFADPCSHDFAGTNGDVARQRSRLSVAKLTQPAVPVEA